MEPVYLGKTPEHPSKDAKLSLGARETHVGGLAILFCEGGENAQMSLLQDPIRVSVRSTCHMLVKTVKRRPVPSPVLLRQPSVVSDLLPSLPTTFSKVLKCPEATGPIPAFSSSLSIVSSNTRDP